MIVITIDGSYLNHYLLRRYQLTLRYHLRLNHSIISQPWGFTIGLYLRSHGLRRRIPSKLWSLSFYLWLIHVNTLRGDKFRCKRATCDTLYVVLEGRAPPPGPARLPGRGRSLPNGAPRGGAGAAWALAEPVTARGVIGFSGRSDRGFSGWFAIKMVTGIGGFRCFGAFFSDYLGMFRDALVDEVICFRGVETSNQKMVVSLQFYL